MIVGVEGETPQVLVVDDVAQNREILRDMLEPLGFEVAQAEHGMAALAYLENHQPQLIITDIRMPEMDGIALVQQLRQMEKIKQIKQTVIIATSASVYREDRHRCLQAGCHAFLPKPINHQVLLQTIQEHLNLTWRYASPEPDISAMTEIDLQPPPPEILSSLWENGKVGDWAALQATLNDLSQEPAYRPFVDELQPLVKRFAIRQVQDTLRRYVVELE